MSEEIKRGFYTEKYSEDLEIETLMTGDGKSQFNDIKYKDGTASIGISYGQGEGVNTKTHHHRKLDKEMDVKWQIKFDSTDAVDSMIETLYRVKGHLMG